MIISKKLMKLSKPELVAKITTLKGRITAMKNNSQKRSFVLRNYNFRIKHVIKELNWIMDHPWSVINEGYKNARKKKK